MSIRRFLAIQSYLALPIILLCTGCDKLWRATIEIEIAAKDSPKESSAYYDEYFVSNRHEVLEVLTNYAKRNGFPITGSGYQHDPLKAGRKVSLITRDRKIFVGVWEIGGPSPPKPFVQARDALFEMYSTKFGTNRVTMK